MSKTILKEFRKELKAFLKIGEVGQKEAKEDEYKGFWRGWLRATEELTSYINVLKEIDANRKRKRTNNNSRDFGKKQ